MKFESKDLLTSFEVGDDLTVKQVLDFNNRIFRYRNEENIFWRNFIVAVPLIVEWKSEVLPDVTKIFASKESPDEPEDFVYLDEVTDMRLVDLIMWVGNVVSNHVAALEQIEKK